MLHTSLVKGQFIRVGEAHIQLKEIKDINGKGTPKIVLCIDAPQSVQIEFDQRKSGPKN